MGKTGIIFVTGTDTGVGKTVLTTLLLLQLRKSGAALGVKPFCSGSRADVRLLRWAQDGELSESEINPFYFSEPVAPLVAARKHRQTIEPQQVLAHIAGIADRCECLLIEGAGGLLVPLVKNFTTLDLIARLRCEVIIVSCNKLGTINHTLLTVQALQRGRNLHRSHTARVCSLSNVVLMTHGSRDASSASNAKILREFLHPIPLITFPFLGHDCSTPRALKASQKKIKKTLARILR